MKKLIIRSCRTYETETGRRFLDIARQQFVPAGPEEAVRQSVLRSLNEEYGYPLSSLRSEVICERGTSDRGRADVLIVLPNLKQSFAIELLAPAADKSFQLTYSEQVALLKIKLNPLPDIRFVDVPDFMEIKIAEFKIRARTLGFEATGYGHSLVFEITEQDARKYNVPRLARFQVDGYGLSEGEQALARSLSIRPCEWCDPESNSFHEEIEGILLDGIDDPNLVWSYQSFAETYDTGGIVIGATVDARFGVLTYLSSQNEKLEEFIKSLRSVRTPTLTCHTDAVDLEHPDLEQFSADFPNDSRTLLVVECKASNINYSERIKEQGLRYAKKMGAAFLVLTCGNWTRSFSLANGEWPTEIDDIPTYAEAISAKKFSVTRSPEAPVHEFLPDSKFINKDILQLHVRNRSIVGCDTPDLFWKSILLIDDFLKGVSKFFYEPFDAYGVRFLEDLGLQDHDAKCTSGGRFPGIYRCILIELESGKQAMLCCMISSSIKAVNHPVFKNLKGTSTFVFVVSAGAEFSPALQFCIDRSLNISNNVCKLVHDGRITVGRGAAKTSTLLRFLHSHQPKLVADGVVNLGSFVIENRLTWENMKDVFSRFCAYAVLRHEYKNNVRMNRKRKT